MSERMRLVVDGKPRELTAEPAMPLLYALRADLWWWRSSPCETASSRSPAIRGVARVMAS